jgi:hypothetical protein
MLNLQPVAMMADWSSVPHPRYLSFVKVPPEDVTAWLTGFVLGVKTMDNNLLLLFARTHARARISTRIHTAQSCSAWQESRPVPHHHALPRRKQKSMPRNTSNMPRRKADQERRQCERIPSGLLASFVGKSQRRNQVTDSTISARSCVSLRRAVASGSLPCGELAAKTLRHPQGYPSRTRNS